MARLYLESWAADHGPQLERDELFEPAAGSVDTTVEVREWTPLAGADDHVEMVGFVDGVRRVDARLTIDDPEAGPIPGLCASVVVGGAVWDRRKARSTVEEARVLRLAILGGGRGEQLPSVSAHPPYLTEAVPAAETSALLDRLHTRMRGAEGEMARELAGRGWFVVADGPLNDLAAAPMVGYVKSHRVSYLPPELNHVVAALAPGERTPLFTIADYRRYSWYVRLATLRGGHSWTGVARCEASGALPREEVRRMADRTAAMLPLLASSPHRDPRAPQNLVPVGGLERELRRRLGDVGLLHRELRKALMREEAIA